LPSNPIDPALDGASTFSPTLKQSLGLTVDPGHVEDICPDPQGPQLKVLNSIKMDGVFLVVLKQHRCSAIGDNGKWVVARGR
jgi:hypothetical protein